ncbi:MAG TPA: SPOR domain-containing protein [Candidatus Eisenbacteria bacterium]|nr:SPOR domain-containing protein [Candidatus Eisenbacteria bacterium]
MKRNARHYYYTRGQLLVLALAFAITALIVLALGVLSGQNEARTRTLRRLTSSAEIRASLSQSESHSEAPSPFEENAVLEGTPKKTGASPGDAGPLRPPVPPLTSVSAQAPEPANPQPFSAEPNVAVIRATRPAWTVQVQSLQEKAGATAAAERLRSRGYDASVVEAQRGPERWYRVRVGRFANRGEAENIKHALSQEGFTDALVLEVKPANPR